MEPTLPRQGEGAEGMNLTIQVTKTSRGDQDYVQIMSDDYLSVNIVLVADHIKVLDDRAKPAPAKGEGR
jgi:hypothetical protein